MAHNFKDKNIGVGITGSYCTYKKVFEELRRLADTQANLFTIFSDNASSTDSRFGKCKDFLKLAEEISGKPPITTIPDAEPIGPKSMEIPCLNLPMAFLTLLCLWLPRLI